MADLAGLNTTVRKIAIELNRLDPDNPLISAAMQQQREFMNKLK